MESAKSLSVWMAIPASIRGLIRTMRPKQWAKNGFVFVAILFDQQLFEPSAFLRVLGAFIAFSFTASAVYLMNDLVDIERDREHPKKKHRPLPSGQLPIPMAQAAMILLPLLAVGGAFFLNIELVIVLAAYLALQIAYSFYLKNVVIIDVFCIAAGFVLRTIAGIVVITVTTFSSWLYVCVGLLALFLAIGKRRQELILLQLSEADITKVRDTYKGYNLPLLDDMLRMVVTSAAVAYTLYATEAETILIEADPALMLLTVPFVYYGLFRYMYVIHRLGKGGDPTEVLFEDRPLQVTIASWVGVIIILLYIVG
ncbi:MAG: decaprenyl-phosphate phosphoribosyltransferase [Phototrophicales bacterium]|nr:MAG: decaprenyl-phosphate phosphoribosyltransferase [Phototrophicales bacterium]